jgi:hypothetical protein
MAIEPLKNLPNEAILNAIRNDATSEYRNRIPKATQANLRDTLNSLTQYRPMWNQFVDALVNRIGSVVARNISWTNPLQEFKRGMLNYGDTIEEIQVGLLKAHIYDPDRDYMEKAIFGTEAPEVQANFHRVNRENFYKITINEPQLQRAFLENGGLSSFVSQLMAAPSTSDQWDEFLMTCKLFSEYESNGGFYRVQIPDIASIESSPDDARKALRSILAVNGNMRYVSRQYNAARMPTFANADEMVMFTTPEFQAAINVEALAAAFNIEKADIPNRVITIPKAMFEINGCEAILTTKDFFVLADTRLENASQYNPVSLGMNYFLHHWEIISASRFAPAVMFSTLHRDEIVIKNEPITGITDISFEGDATNVMRGGLVAFTASGKTAKSDNPPNGAVIWSVSGGTSNRTHITSTGVLHCGYDETATTLTVKAQTAYIPDDNPRDDGFSTTKPVPVVGDKLGNWPVQGSKDIAITVKGVSVPVVSGTYTYTLAGVGTATAADVEVSTAPGTTVAGVKASNGGKTITVKIDPGTGAPVDYVVTLS